MTPVLPLHIPSPLQELLLILPVLPMQETLTVTVALEQLSSQGCQYKIDPYHPQPYYTTGEEEQRRQGIQGQREAGNSVPGTVEFRDSSSVRAGVSRIVPG